MLHTALLYVHCVQYARQYYTYKCVHTTLLHYTVESMLGSVTHTNVYIQRCDVLCGVPNTEYGRVGFPIPALEGITLASSTIKLGQVGYIRCCPILHCNTHFTHVHHRPLLILHNLFFAT